MAAETIRVEGLRELEAKLRRIPPRIARNTVGAALRTGARIILRQAKQNARRAGGTGTLARALVMARDRRARRDAPAYAIYARRGKSYQMGMRQGRQGSNRRANRSNMDGYYFRWVELGTKPHDIPRRPGRVLRWMAGGQPMFARRVRHPGSKPRPILGPAYSAKRNEALAAIRTYMRQRIEREAAQA